MAVELMMGFRSEGIGGRMEEKAVQEAASAGLQSMERLVRMLSQQQEQCKVDSDGKAVALVMEHDCSAAADMAVSKFRKMISLLGRTRTGHARFRRAPLSTHPPPGLIAGNPGGSDAPRVLQISKKEKRDDGLVLPILPPPPPPPPSSYHLHHRKTQALVGLPKKGAKESVSNFSSSSLSAASSFVSSPTGDADAKHPISSSAFHIVNLPQQVSSAARPPLSLTSLKRKCGSKSGGGSQMCATASGRCHCSKKRKSRVRRVVRVPAISLKMSDIPSDDFSWRKYGQKPIKGSPYPRGYYKCSSMRGCPARKHVERALDDPAMLMVTYEGEHNHSLSMAEASPSPP